MQLPASKASPSPVLRNARVLVADDQPDVVEALRLLLKGEGSLVETVTSPAAVLRSLADRPFDVLLMDLNYTRDTTSGQEGLDLLTRIKETDDTLPVVVMTAWATIDLALAAVHRGVGDFVQKPWDNTRLLNILQEQILRGRAQRHARRLEDEKKALDDSAFHQPNLKELLKRFAIHLREKMGCERVVILARVPGQALFLPASVLGLAEPAASLLRFESGDEILGSADGIVDLRGSGSPSSARSNLLALGLVLGFPIMQKGDLLAWVLLGERREGRDFEPGDREFLEVVAAHMAAGISGAVADEQERDFNAAREIQVGFLPKSLPRLPGFQAAGIWQPARVVGGDYYDVFSLGDHHAAVCIADVVGKGMPAALLMSNLQAATKAVASESAPPDALCTRVNQIICSNTTVGKFITFFYGRLDVNGRRLAYCNAGHNPPFVVRRDGRHARLAEGGAALGFNYTWNYQQGEFQLDSGDRVVLFTDGVTEAESPQGEEFGEERLLSVLQECRYLPAVALQEKILRSVGDFAAGEFRDDVTLIVLSVD
jgi:FixJ family two-component response regulator